MKLASESLATLALLYGSVIFNTASAPAQDVAQTYRQAAAAYREASAKSASDKKDCYNEWAGYYDCLADQLQSGSSVECKKPSCKPWSD